MQLRYRFFFESILLHNNLIHWIFNRNFFFGNDEICKKNNAQRTCEKYEINKNIDRSGILSIFRSISNIRYCLFFNLFNSLHQQLMYKAKKFSVHTLEVKRWPIFHAKLLTSSVHSKFICMYTIEQWLKKTNKDNNTQKIS